ncbi:uncharacterized protein LOC128285436 [Gossypium arboreum]|uniref:uncharacterized protein LOC128285436 n=1 Tax=Gossypium arboreum TaxID=29729 RepID=UPI0022F1509A|nr:uncharacterized protein LOC128285436 [Gossypium arboreum]
MVAGTLSCRAMTDPRAVFAHLSLFDDGSLLAELQIESANTVDFRLNSEGVLCFRGKIYVPKDTDLRQTLLREAHSSPYAMHPSRNKMNEIFVRYIGGQHALGSELVSDTEDKVRLILDQLKAASNRQKSYADLKCKEIKYSAGDFVFLKVSPWKKNSGAWAIGVFEGNRSVWRDLRRKVGMWIEEELVEGFVERCGESFDKGIKAWGSSVPNVGNSLVPIQS